MQLAAVWLLLAAAAAAAPRSMAAVDLMCDCRLSHLRDPALALHCTRAQGGTSGVSCQKAMVPDLPRGYQHVAGYGLVKLYRTFQTWWAAKETCRADGARLAVPPDQHAVNATSRMFTPENGLWWAWVGISDEATEGEFVGVDGRPAPFLPWQPNTPSDHEGKENCVNTRKDGLYNDLNCDWPSPFFCERRLAVGVPASYRWEGEAGRFYRVHQEKRPRKGAEEACRAENATLAVPDSWRRGEALLALLKPEGVAYHIGLTDLAREGDFVTETGRHLNDMEFRVWGYGEPNNGHGKEEDCLALTGEGFYSDVDCDLALPFICEIVPA